MTWKPVVGDNVIRLFPPAPFKTWEEFHAHNGRRSVVIENLAPAAGRAWSLLAAVNERLKGIFR